MQLSVVVVNWNSRDDLQACLASLRAQTHRDLEIVVVDNGSTDDSCDVVRRDHPHVVLLEQSENLGFAEGCNRGIAATNGEWVAMLNNDTVADPRWAEALVDAAAICAPTCGMLQSVMLLMDRPDEINATGIALTATGAGFARQEGQPRSAAIAEEIFCATAGAAAYRRAMLDAVKLPTGYFDREYFMYYEDLDLGWRARIAGWSARLVPESVVLHRHQGSSRRFGARWLAAISRTNRLRTLIKNASRSFLVRTLGQRIRDCVELLWHARAKGAIDLPGVIVSSWAQRAHVTAIAKERREAVEQRWIDSKL